MSPTRLHKDRDAQGIMPERLSDCKRASANRKDHMGRSHREWPRNRTQDVRGAERRYRLASWEMSNITLKPIFKGDLLTYAHESVQIDLRAVLAAERGKSAHLRVLGMILSAGVLTAGEVAACANAFQAATQSQSK